MIIQVNKKHIKLGLRRDPHKCPVGLALRQVFGKHQVTVPGEEQSKFIKVGLRKFNMPRNVRRFVKRFDNEKPVQPFSFNLNMSSKEPG